MRADLPAGFAMAMCLHAAGETGPAPAHTIAVALSCADERELLALAELDADSHIIYECDGPFAGQACSIGFPPTAVKKKCYSHLRLWAGGMRP